MCRNKRVTPDQELKMRELKKLLTIKEVGAEMNLPYSTVHYYLNATGTKRKAGNAQQRHGYYTREKDRPGVFNVNHRENWLI